MSEPDVKLHQYLVEMNEIVRVSYRVAAVDPQEAVRMCVEDSEVSPVSGNVEFVATHSVHQVFVAV